jgi:hypothetical protein
MTTNDGRQQPTTPKSEILSKIEHRAMGSLLARLQQYIAVPMLVQAAGLG